MLNNWMHSQSWTKQIKKFCGINVPIRNVEDDGSLQFAATNETLLHESYKANIKSEWQSSIVLPPNFKNNTKCNNVFPNTNILTTWLFLCKIMRIKSLCIKFVEYSYCKVKSSAKNAQACIYYVKCAIFGKSDLYPSKGISRFNSPHKHKTLLYVPFPVLVSTVWDLWWTKWQLDVLSRAYRVSSVDITLLML